MQSVSLRAVLAIVLATIAAVGTMLGITKAAPVTNAPQPLLAEADQCTKAEKPDIVFVSCGGFF